MIKIIFSNLPTTVTEEMAPIMVDRATAKGFIFLPPIRNSEAAAFASPPVFLLPLHPAQIPMPKDAINDTTNTAQSPPLKPAIVIGFCFAERFLRRLYIYIYFFLYDLYYNFDSEGSKNCFLFKCLRR